MDYYMPTPSFTFKTLDGSQLEIFMSFGLLNTLVKIIRDPEVCVQLAFIHDIRDEFLEALLQERSKTGRVIGDANKLEDMQLDPISTYDLLAWAEEHVLDFFLLQAQRLQPIDKKIRDLLGVQTPSTPG